MRIAYLALSESLGGRDAGFTHSAKMCEALSTAGNEVELFTQAGKKTALNKVKVHELRLHKNPLKRIAQLRQLKKFLQGFDVIHERYSVNPQTLLLTKGSGAVHVLEVNDPGIETWNGVKRIVFAPMIAAKLDSADAIITQTGTLKKILQKQAKKQVFVVSNGVEPEDFAVPKSKAAGERKKIGRRAKNIVAFAGSFREWHGAGIVPEIAEKVLAECPGTVFVMAGDGREREKTLQAVEMKGLQKNFVFMKGVAHEKIPRLLSAADVCIAPFSLNNFPQMKQLGFWWCPVKLFEYMAAGRPTVSFDFAEVRKILGDSALLAKPDDIEGFASLVIKALKDKKLAQRLGAEGKRRAKKNSWKIKAKETVAVYAAIAKKKHPQRPNRIS
ncbi:MAG: glycosyltransferase family 4 protein [Candidatus Diapherotrites archaeon]|nr:glycosyltransferase family 4 protein [Candidatus Diapherotrites archaeon]